MVIVAAWEEGLSTEHLCEHIADGPHINGTGIFLEGEYDLQGMVPLSGNIFGHEGVCYDLFTFYLLSNLIHDTGPLS